MMNLFVAILFAIFVNSPTIFGKEFGSIEILNDDPWPHVPDPKFPKMPLEFLNSVDPTCQCLFYIGTRVWSAIPDRSIINFFHGCKRVSRGFCRTKKCLFRSPSIGDICFYKRSMNGGVWFASGLNRKVQPKCTTPPDLAAVMENSMANLLMFTSTRNWTTNETVRKLPRAIGLPYPAPMPRKWAKEYADECRVTKSLWNILWQKIPYKEFYTNCNFTADSGKYCMAKEYRTEDHQQQWMNLRSTSGFYQIDGFKERETVLPACQLYPQK